MGFDIGNILANLIFALVHCFFENPENHSFINFICDTICKVIDLFKLKFIKAAKERVSDIMAKDSSFLNWYLADVLSYTAGTTGLELIRRIVGMAKVQDITSISSEADRAEAEMICLTCAKKFIIEKDKFTSGDHFIRNIKECINKKSLMVMR